MTTWQTQQSSAHLERAILTGMIVSDRALRVIGLAYKPKYLIAPFGQEVAKWCLRHQDRYNRAPKADIQTLFEAHGRGLDDDTARLVSQLLSSLSNEFEALDAFNEQLCIDTALEYFRERSLAILQEDLAWHLEGRNLAAAQAAVADFSAPGNHVSMGFEPFDDMEGMREAFENRDGLLTLPGDLGRMVGPLERDWMFMVVGKYKGSKSFTCQWIAQQARYARLNVAWFDLELGEARLRRRLAQGICAMPLKPPREGSGHLVPVWDCQENQTGECSRPMRANSVALIQDKGRPDFAKAPHGYRPCVACKEGTLDTWFAEKRLGLLDWRTAWRKAQAVAGSVAGARLKVQSWPKFSAGIDDVRASLQTWRYMEGFVPDVIVVDQPDIMKMPGKGDVRHRIDELWKQLGAIPQELHCLLVVPSQAGGKDAQERRKLRVSDVAEDSRKLGHVDASLIIDQSDEDKAAQRAVLSTGVGRDDEVARPVMVLQALGLGQAVLDSRTLKL